MFFLVFVSFCVGIVYVCVGLCRFVSCLCCVLCILRRYAAPSASHQDLARAQTASPTMLSEAAFHSELALLESEPVSDLERIVATRSLVRYERLGIPDEHLNPSASEDWVRLYIALRRAHLPNTRITPALLRAW